MATNQLTTRRDFLRAFQSCAVQARKDGNRQDWQTACREWERLATPTEKRKAPASIARPWES